MENASEYVTLLKDANATNFTRQSPRVIDVKYFGFYSRDEEVTFQLRHVLTGYIMPVVIALGIVGNILAFVTFTKGRFKAQTYTYFTCLAVSDLIAMVAWIPHVVMWGWQLKRNSYGEMFYYAHVFMPSVMLTHNISGYLLLAITVDRYVAVCYPLKIKAWSTRGRTMKVASGCVVIPSLVLVPIIFYMHVRKLHNTADTTYVFQGRSEDIYISERNSSYTTHPLHIAWAVMSLTIVLIHQLVIITLTIRVAIGYRRTRHSRVSLRLDSMNSSSSSSSGSSKDPLKMADFRRLIVLMMCVSVINMIFLSPVIFIMGPMAFLGPAIMKVPLACLPLLLTCNSSINFYVYLLGLRHFRKEFLSLITHVTHGKKGTK